MAVGRTGTDFAVMRFNTNGSLDTTFDSDGWLTHHFDGASAAATGVTIDSQLNTLVTGYYVSCCYSSSIFLARVDSSGGLDTNGFGTGGIATTKFSNYQSFPFGVALQTEGKIVVAGHSAPSPGVSDFALARFTSDGSLDPSFGNQGHAIFDLSTIDGGSKLAIQADGRIVVAGYTGPYNVSLDFALIRFNPDGTLDDDPNAGFGDGGWVTTDFTSGRDVPFGLAFQNDAKIVVGGESSAGGVFEFAMARYAGVNNTVEQIDLLVAQVQNLVTLEALNQGQGNSLQVKLLGAIQQADRGNVGAAINIIESFINQANDLMDSGVLLLGEGEPLIASAQAAIAALQQ